MNSPKRLKTQNPAVNSADLAAAVLATLHVAPDRVAENPAAVQLMQLIDSMAADGCEKDDPIREIMARLGDKWCNLLLLLLRAGPFRHATLRKLTGILGAERKISQRIFTLRLRSLERDGLIVRTVTPTIPPRVDYALSELGQSLVAQQDSLMNWVRAHDKDIREARRLFESA